MFEHIRKDGTKVIFRNKPQDWHSEDIDQEYATNRKIFVVEKTLAGLTHVCEELWKSPSKATREVHDQYYYKRFDQVAKRPYACALVQAFNIFTEDEKREMNRTKRGRKELRNRRPQYQFLVWYLYESDKERIKEYLEAEQDISWISKNLVPISRMMSFFPQAVPTITTTQAEEQEEETTTPSGKSRQNFFTRYDID